LGDASFDTPGPKLFGESPDGGTAGGADCASEQEVAAAGDGGEAHAGRGADGPTAQGTLLGSVHARATGKRAERHHEHHQPVRTHHGKLLSFVVNTTLCLRNNYGDVAAFEVASQTYDDHPGVVLD
jgi:hypothetical protein